MTIIRGVGLVMVLVAAGAPVAQAQVAEGVVADVARRFAAELECGKPEKARKQPAFLHRHWCAAAGLDKAGFTAPASRRTWLGVSVGLKPDDKVVPAVLGTTGLAILTAGPEGVLVTDLRPSNDKEQQELGMVVASLAFVLKGKAKAVEVSAGLAGFLKSFDKKALHPVSAGAYHAKMPSRIYSARGSFGAGYLVLEQAPDGIRLSLFPDAPFVAK